MQVIWKRHFSQTSSRDKGTLKQIQNLIHRTNLPSSVKANYTAVRDFISIVLDAHLVSAAMEYFGMPTTNSKPRLPPHPHPSITRRAYAEEVIGTFMDKYILPFVSFKIASEDGQDGEEGTLPDMDRTEVGQGSHAEGIPQDTDHREVGQGSNAEDILQDTDHILAYGTSIIGHGLMA